jgi:hypothetical protein
MLTFIATQTVASSASEPAFAGVRFKPEPPTATGRFRSTIRGSIKWRTVQTMSGRPAFLAIHRPDFPQGPFTLHTSTALAA